MKKWLFLDCEQMDDVYSFVYREMSEALKLNGQSSVLVKLWTKGEMLWESKLFDVIKQHDPDFIVWTGGDGWEYFDVLKKHRSSKINLWYDDPIQRLTLRPKVVNAMAESGNHDFTIMVWDRYWGEMLNKMIGVNWRETELASDPKVYFTAKRRLSDEAVFIGALQSPNWIYNEINRMPGMFRVFMEKCREVLNHSTNILSWDQVMQAAEAIMGAGDLNIFSQQSKGDPASLRHSQAILWAMSKNEARVKLLKEAIKVTPVLIFAETGQRNHANAYELQGMIGEWDSSKLRIIDTSKTAGDCLGQLYHYGKIHLQAVDPQSVYGGIPYRMYQTAASGRPIFTDVRKDWSKSFPDDQRIRFNFADNIADQLSDALKRADLEEMGMASRSNFEKNHTWQKRMTQLEYACGDTALNTAFHKVAQDPQNKIAHTPITLDSVNDFNGLAEKLKSDLKEVTGEARSKSPQEIMADAIKKIDLSVDNNYKAPALPVK